LANLKLFFLSTIAVLLIVLFIVGYPLLIGYIIYNQSYLEVYCFIISLLYSNTDKWNNFIPILTTFYVGILSFMIPIGIQMISTIRKDFPTEQIEERFKKEFTFKYLPIILILQILFVGSFELIKNQDKTYPIALGLIFISLLAVSYMVYRHIKRLIEYTDKNLVVNWLIEDTKKYITKENNVEKSIISLRSLSDILVEEINKTPNYDLVFKLIEELRAFSISFIPTTNTYKESEIQHNDKYFEEVVKSIKKIMKKSIEINNYDIVLQVEFLIYDVIKTIISKKNNQHYLEELFNTHRELFYYCVEKNNPYQYYFAYQWYSHFIFNQYDKKNIFDTDYLAKFDNLQFNYIKYIIGKNKINLFKEIVSWFHQGIGFQNNHIDLYSYDTNDMQNNFRFISKLDEISHNIRSLEELKNFLHQFNELENIVKQNYKTKEELDELQSRTDEIVSYAYQQFFFNNLKNMVFGISSYCVYRQKYGYIKTIWEFKQPKHSRTNWVGHDIYPQTIAEVVDFLIINGSRFDRKFAFQDEHHDSEYYEKQFELYLLGYLIHKNGFKKDSKYLSNKSESQLSSIEFYSKELKKKIDNIYNHDNIETFRQLGFDDISDDIIDNLKENIKVLFTNLILECNTNVENFERTTELSEDKINEFKNELIKGMNDRSSVKKLIEYYEHYEKTSIVKKDKGFGIKQLYPRPIFFENWISSYVGFEDNLCRSMIEGENKTIINKLIKYSKIITGDDVEDVLSSFIDIKNIFILSINHSLYDLKESTYFGKNKFFDKYQSGSKQNESYPQSWYGDLNYQETKIPVYQFYIQGLNESVLIFDKTKFLKYIQYLPDDKNISDVYLINIIDTKILSDDEMKKEINFKDVSKEKEQEKILEYRKSLILEFFESFEIELDEDFIGYMFYTKEDELI
jgi:hypothetical protein